MKSILIGLIFLSPFANALDCEIAYKNLEKEAARMEFKTVKKLCDYLDEVGMESEMFREVYACRSLIAGKCPIQIQNWNEELSSTSSVDPSL